MRTAEVIIGANFGDEGKGLITDYRAAHHGGDALVVRYNGGAQAGHTVATPDGRRHVFSHFGCGSFAGAATFLSRFFASNPLLFVKEYQILERQGLAPRVFIDRDAAVTTPYDMMINQIVEEARGTGRHGSCGVGFGETIERTADGRHALVHGDLADHAALARKLDAIRDEWVPRRLAALGISAVTQTWRERLAAPGIQRKFMDDVAFQLDSTVAVSRGFLAGVKGRMVFEGAQGLLLDQDHAWFPHVTRSYTGLRNVLSLARDAGVDQLNVTYVTRAYMTRHGNGPLPHELDRPPYAGVKDETNITNPYQGALRFGWLDADRLKATIAADLAAGRAPCRIEHGLAVTCLDQVDDSLTYIKDGRPRTTSRDTFIETLRRTLDPDFMLTSHGPRRSDVAMHATRVHAKAGGQSKTEVRATRIQA